MSSVYIVRWGESIGDVALNSTGSTSVANLNLILDANNFDNWSPTLTSGQAIIIPDGVTIDQNALRQLTTYPADNHSVPDVYNQIGGLSDIIADDWILRTGFWNDAEHWHDTKFWIDGDESSSVFPITFPSTL